MMLRFTTLLFILFSATASQAQLNFDPRGVGGGGALFFPRINPANDNEFYIACDMSEMFHSTDYGNTYNQLHFTKMPAMNVSTYEFTNNSNIAYSTFNDGNEGYPVKTTDGGATWVPVPGYDANEGMVYRMMANYNNPLQLLMNYYDKIVITNNGGTTFQTIATATNSGAGLIMGGVFFDGSNIYIGTNDGLLVSSNSGTSFTTMNVSGIPVNEVIWSFSGGKVGANTRFVCITADVGDVYNGVQPYEYYDFPQGVYVMNNANGTWLPSSTGIDFNSEFVMYTGMAWNDINTIYLAGSDNGSPLVYKSINGGTSWNKVFNSAGNVNIKTGWSGQGGDKGWGWGESCFGIAVAPNNSGKVLFGDFGFVHVTSDGGANWKQAYVNNTDQHPAGANTPTQQTYHSIGLENTTCWQVTWQSATKMMTAYSDIGSIRSADGGGTWGFTHTGLSVNSVYHIEKNPSGTMFAGSSGIHDMYQSTRLADAQLNANDAAGKISYSTNDGASWTLLHQFNHPVFWLAIDPNNANRMYASVIHSDTNIGGIYITQDLNALGSSTWTKLPAPPRTEGHPACITVLNDGKMVCTFSGRRTTNFTASSGVFLYDPVTGLWDDVSDPTNMYYWTKDIVIDPSDPTQNTWYACVFTGWGVNAGGNKGGLYKTTNRGQSWTKLTASQFDRVTSITFNPLDLNQAYLTTETQGLWVSNNMNVATPTWTLVDEYDFRQPERVFFNPYDQEEMWVTSFGNGMKIGTQTSAIRNTATTEKISLKIYPNPSEDVVNIQFDKNTMEAQYLEIYDAAGRLAKKVSPSGSGITSINVAEWPTGIYFVSYGNYKGKFVKR